MTERDSIERELEALRHAAARDDPNRAMDAAAKLLRRLAPTTALELARKRLERFLAAFERHQPGVTWPRELLESLRAPARQGEENQAEWDWSDADFPGPGANSFINGVDRLWRAYRLAPGDSRRIELLVDAIAASIQAEGAEAWGTRHPTRWAFWYENAFTEEPAVSRERTQVLLDLQRDSETVRRTRAAWLDVANQLAEALGAPPRP